jgi:hypothetical protein
MVGKVIVETAQLTSPNLRCSNWSRTFFVITMNTIPTIKPIAVLISGDVRECTTTQISIRKTKSHVSCFSEDTYVDARKSSTDGNYKSDVEVELHLLDGFSCTENVAPSYARLYDAAIIMPPASAIKN